MHGHVKVCVTDTERTDKQSAAVAQAERLALIRRVESSQASLTAMLPGSHPSVSSVGMQSEKLHPGFQVVEPSSDRTTYLY